MSNTNNTTDTTPFTSALPLCPPLSDVAGTNDTYVTAVNDTVQLGCRQRNTSRNGKGSRGSLKVKTFYMHPKLEDTQGLILSYDPMIGIQTAAILGSCLFLVMAYVIYKGKCRREQWTSSDRLFIENYKRKQLTRQWTVVQKQDINEDTGKSESGSFEQTAKWIQSQPLDESLQSRNLCKLTTCNICLESLKNPMCHLCSSNGHVPKANGLLLSAPQISMISHSEVDITKYENMIEMEMLQPPSFRKKCRHQNANETEQTQRQNARPSSLALRKGSISNNGNNNTVTCILRDETLNIEDSPLRTRAVSTNDLDIADASSIEKLNSKNLNADFWPQDKVKKPNCDNMRLPRSRPRLTKQNRLLESPPLELDICDPAYSVPNKIPCTPIPLVTVPPLRSTGSSEEILEQIKLPILGAPALPQSNPKILLIDHSDSDATSCPLLLSANREHCDKTERDVTAPMTGQERRETDKLLERIPYMDDGSNCGSIPPSPQISTTKL